MALPFSIFQASNLRKKKLEKYPNIAGTVYISIEHNGSPDIDDFIIDPAINIEMLKIINPQRLFAKFKPCGIVFDPLEFIS